jgi:Trypsin-like peptidase domain
MLVLTILLLVPGEAPAEAKEISKEQRAAALGATVRVVNAAGRCEGTGAIVGRSGPHVYVLTAAHVVYGAEKVEIHTCSATSPAEEKSVYKSGEVVARTKDARDLALVRLATRDEMPGRLRICPSRRVPAERGFAALSVGCSDGKPPTSRDETVAGKKLIRRPGDKEAVLTWEVKERPAAGRSGGPLVDARGYLLGVCSGASGREGYYGHTDVIHGFLKDNGFRWLFEEEDP